MGPDELRARQLLLDMQERLGRDPYEAFGLTNTDPGEVRSAFLQLTKIYHPARFARMSGEIQRLANEVFLALRASHDALVRAQVKPSAPRSTGMIPVTRTPIATNRAPSGVLPTVRQPSAPATPAAPAAPMPPRTGTGPVARPATSPAVAARPATGTAPATGTNPATPRPGTASGPGQPIRPATSDPRSSSPPSAQTTQPMRPVGAGDPARPNRMPQSSPPPSSMGSDKFAATPARPGAAAPATASTGAPELVAIEELLAQDRLTDARMKLETLVARHPDVPRYKALIHYAKGREAQLAGRRDEARLELLDALDLVADLQLANTALGELLTRRK